VTVGVDGRFVLFNERRLRLERVKLVLFVSVREFEVKSEKWNADAHAQYEGDQGQG
jgi:hypothetical protein